jgi:transposase
MIFLIVDGHSIHTAKRVARCSEIDSMKKRVRLFFLAPDSPELNPDERVWNDLKNYSIGRQVITAPDQMHRAVISHLRCIQKSPEPVLGYLKNNATQCAA